MEHRKPIRSFEDLFVWQLAIELVKQIYLITSKGSLKTDFATPRLNLNSNEYC